MKLIALMFAVPAALGIWLAIFLRWQRGIYFLVAFLPYAGVVTLMMRPSPVGTLVKDLLLVLPTYAIFFLMHTAELRKARIPQALTLLLLAFGALVLLQMFNPGLKNMIVGAVGAKVWLLYIPLAYLVSVMIQTPEDLIRLLRLAVAVAVIPCVLGIAEFVLSTAIGYEATMTMIYGRNAADVTQGFAFFRMGADFFRIPSTFTYITQYSGFTLMMVVVVYMHQSIEFDLRWRAFSRVMIAVVFIACMLSGARSNFLFTPFLFLLILFLDAKLTRLAIGLLFGPLVMATTLQVAGLDILQLFTATTALTETYGSDLVIPDLIRSLSNNPLGSGTGMNTGGVINLLSAAEQATLVLIEGYYSKAVVELGVLGVMLLVLIFLAIIFFGLQVRTQLRDPLGRSCAAAIVAFVIIMMLHSFKGWQIDLDPINVWYWIFVGILFRLPTLHFERFAEARQMAMQQKAQHRHPSRRRRQPGRRGVRPGHR